MQDRVLLSVPANSPTRTLGRSSIRPSAFGLPRQRSSESAFVTTAVERLSSPAVRPSSIPASPKEPARGAQAARKKEGGPGRPAVKTDIEALLPISQVVKSLPRPPKLPTFEAPPLPAPTTRRFPWMSLSIFAVVLGASLAPLMRYSGERTIETTSQELTSPSEVDWSELTPLVQSVEHAAWAEPSRDWLLADGEHALSVGDASAAERAFAQAVAYGDDDASAVFGLARARLSRGDRRGARAWAETAVRRRPEEPHYRAFLERLASSHHRR